LTKYLVVKPFTFFELPSAQYEFVKRAFSIVKGGNDVHAHISIKSIKPANKLKSSEKANRKRYIFGPSISLYTTKTRVARRM